VRFERTGFAGLVLVHPERASDSRGHFVRTFCEDEFSGEGLAAQFPQTSLSFNTKAGTVRGMHFQRDPHAETKLVRCSRGAILDAVIDLRPSERTFRQWCGFELSAENGIALYIPPGFAHGFQTLVDETEVSYAITPAFVPGAGTGLRWDDPAINVRWPQPVSVISDRDGTWQFLELV
jgi:dTDP-4-dehydrorhamnose 3,5-epimerase